MDAHTATPEELLRADIFELLNMQDAPAEMKEKMLADMESTLAGEVFAHVVSKVPDEHLERFEEILERGVQQDTLDFLANLDIDMPTVVAEETLKYKYQLVREVEARLRDAQPSSDAHAD